MLSYKKIITRGVVMTATTLAQRFFRCHLLRASQFQLEPLYAYFFYSIRRGVGVFKGISQFNPDSTLGRRSGKGRNPAYWRGRFMTKQPKVLSLFADIHSNVGFCP